MLRKRKYYLWLSVACMLNCCALLAQSLPHDSLAHVPISDTTVVPATTIFTVGDIIITGNKKTRANIILREIPFRKGENYPLKVLIEKFEDARRQLMNTALFHTVVVAAGSFEGNKVNISVTVKERWYLFPAPYFKPIDRNLNQWLIEQKASLKRVEYGAKLYYYNATGRNDKFKFLFIRGYTKQLSFSYDRLYIDKRLKWGLRTGFSSGNNRELNYNTIGDKQVFLKDNENYVGKFLNAYAELTYRRAIKTRHSFGIGFSKTEVEDSILKLNPIYLSRSGARNISVPSLFYSMGYYDLDYNAYPTKGYAAEIYFAKRGFNSQFNLWELHVKGAGYWPLWPKTFLNVIVYAGIKVPFKQPYINQRFLGYGDNFLQGMEYYVIDGVAGGLLKTSFNREMLNFKVRIPNIKKGKEPQYIPFRIFTKVFANTGYVHNPQPGENGLSNKMLYSGGFGIDIISIYDITFKFEWSFNQLGENGLFLHRKSIF
jgi:outer membrane protein assembly factor BamA